MPRRNKFQDRVSFCIVPLNVNIIMEVSGCPGTFLINIFRNGRYSRNDIVRYGAALGRTALSHEHKRRVIVSRIALEIDIECVVSRPYQLHTVVHLRIGGKQAIEVHTFFRVRVVGPVHHIIGIPHERRFDAESYDSFFRTSLQSQEFIITPMCRGPRVSDPCFCYGSACFGIYDSI